MDVGTDERLTKFVRAVLPDVPVSLETPSDRPQTERGVGLYLWQIQPVAPVRGQRMDQLRLTLQYLLNTWAPEPTEAHEMLLDLAYAAMQEPSLDVVLEPLPAEAWLALGVPPTPSFRVGAASRYTAPDHRAKPVLHPLDISAVTMSGISGWVRTPAGLPIAGARVEVPAIDQRSRTDADGHFNLRSLPAAPTAVRVRVDAKGHEAWATVGPTDDRAAVVIELDPLEETNG